jgi:serine/threonine-protein kinase
MNPYNYKTPVSDTELFFGRTSTISKIYSRIGAERPQSVSLVGDPKIGKSSLLWYLAHPKTKERNLHDPDGYVFFYISITDDGTLNFDSFSKMFWDIVLRDIDNYLQLEDKTRSYDLFKKIIERLNQNQKKVIIFFDDFHLTTQNESFPLEFFSFLRSLANNYNLAFVTTSHLDLQKLCVSKEVEESPFFNIFTNLSLKPFEESMALQLISEPSKKFGVDLAGDKDHILKVANFFPYPLQLACHLLFDLRNNRKESSDDEILAFEKTFFEKSESYFENIWSIFDEEQIYVLKEILSSNKIKNTHQFVLNDLMRRKLLQMNGNKVEFVLPHFQKFVTTKLGLKESKNGGNGFINLLKRILFLEKKN